MTGRAAQVEVLQVGVQRILGRGELLARWAIRGRQEQGHGLEEPVGAGEALLRVLGERAGQGAARGVAGGRGPVYPLFAVPLTRNMAAR